MYLAMNTVGVYCGHKKYFYKNYFYYIKNYIIN